MTAAQVSKHDELCVQNEEVRIKNEGGLRLEMMNFAVAHPWGSGATAYLSAAGLGIVHTCSHLFRLVHTSPGFMTWDALPQL